MEFSGVFIKNHKSCFVTLEFPPTSKSRVSTWSGKSQKVREYDQGKVGRKFLSMQFLTSIKKIISTQKCLQLNCIWQSVVYMMLLFASSIKMIIVRTPTLLYKVRGSKFWLPPLEGEIWKIKNKEWKYGAGAVLLKRGDWVRVKETVWNILKEGGTE